MYSEIVVEVIINIEMDAEAEELVYNLRNQGCSENVPLDNIESKVFTLDLLCE
jgi:hypothetical protein